MYLCFIKQRNELCVGNTVMETEILHKNSTIKTQFVDDHIHIRGKKTKY